MRGSASIIHSLCRKLIKILDKDSPLGTSFCYKWVHIKILNKKCMLIKLNPVSLDKFLFIEKQKSELCTSHLRIISNYLFKKSLLSLKGFRWHSDSPIFGMLFS